MDGYRKEKRRVCCCFERRRTCIVTFILILAAIAVGLYFLCPAIPSVDIGEPYVPNNATLSITDASGKPISLASLVDQSGNTVTATFPAAVDISVYSPSYINVGIRRIDVAISVKNRAGEVVDSFKGKGQVVDQRFSSRKTTGFTLVLPSN